MTSFILHSLDCSEMVSRIDDYRGIAPASIDPTQLWTACPSPSSDYVIVPDGEGYAAVLREKSLAEKQAALKDTTEAVLARKFLEGYPIPSGLMAGERLQVRDNTDRTNWLASESEYSDRVIAGLGAYEGATFRTASNTTFVVSFADGLAILKDMRLWAFALMQRSWIIKDAIAAAVDDAGLAEVDPEDGWPS